jgi:nicotinate phosphoribosyltransferase
MSKRGNSLGVHGLWPQGLGLATDLYQITMCAGYWKRGIHNREAVFHLGFRKAPFGGNWAIAGGLGTAAEFLSGWGFDEDDLAFLAELRGADGEPLFEPGFLAWLGTQHIDCDVDAIPEGSLVFAHEPLLRIRGSLAQAQLLETPLLTILNFQTLIATKAARVKLAAGDDTVLEFGLRRAQGLDGGLSASRAAYVGGADATSNVLAARLFGIPVRGTHAHAWVMVFDEEKEAFQAYAEALPNNCVFLVDTYNTLHGVQNAIEIGRYLEDRGQRLLGIRLDSGDLLGLSLQARAMLDAAGFVDAQIVASNDLDEHEISRLKAAGAPIGVWGVGTRLATGHEQSALGGVYKLAAIQNEQGEWMDRVKLSEQAVKVSIPGILQVRRRVDPHTLRFAGDLIWDERDGAPPKHHPDDHDLLVPLFRRGEGRLEQADLNAARARRAASLARLPEGVLENRLAYGVELEAGVERRRAERISIGQRAGGVR